MKISKKDSLMWFEFFSEYMNDEYLSVKQQELVYAVLSQIEEAVEARHAQLMSEIKNLKNLSSRTYFVGDEAKFSQGCVSCLTGCGLTTIRKTNKCNVECKFCYNYGELNLQEPIGEGMWEIGSGRFRENDLDLVFDVYGKPNAVAYVYLEPFMEIEVYYSMIKKFASAGVYQHMYTNGTLATEENLKALGEAGLNELRFNLGATACSDKVIKNMAIAKKYIPKVGIETPMTPEFYNAFNEKKDKILSTGLDLINCAELHLNPNNIGNYYGENLYMSRQGYISPIYSREISLKMLKQADAENWNILVHDCSNRTKFARGLNLKKKEGAFFGDNAYGCEFDIIPYEYFLPVLKDEDFKFITEEELPKEYQVGMVY